MVFIGPTAVLSERRMLDQLFAIAGGASALQIQTG
jgi:hypothetical protein